MDEKNYMPITPAEYDAMAKNAARYQWLRENWDKATGYTWANPLVALDNFVDEQMKQGNGGCGGKEG